MSTTIQCDFAKRQLERMGWKEGSGLGKDRQGRAVPIIVKQRSDVTGGLGIEKEKVRQVQQTIQDEWWKDAIGDTLSKLCEKNEKKKKRKRDTERKNSELCTSTETTTKKKTFTDEELFLATGGARFGMRAGKTRNQAKWRRTEAPDAKLAVQRKGNDDETVVWGSATASKASGIETKSLTKIDSVDDEAQAGEHDSSSKEKSKSKKSPLDKKVDSMKKKKKDKLKKARMIEQPQETNEPSNTDSTIITKPSREEKRKKKKK